MTREEIQKELDALKGSRFDKTSDDFLHYLEGTSKKCPYCQKLVIGSVSSMHIESCRKDEEIIAKIMDTNSRTLSIRKILEDCGIGSTSTPGKRIYDKLRARGFISQAVNRVSDMEDPFLRIIEQNPDMTRSELSETLKCDMRLIDRLAQTTGVSLNKRVGQVRLQTKERVIQMFKQGMTKVQIAKEVGYHQVTVGRILKSEGI